ncbi:SprT family zinc-dependent metalloprotease [Sulfurimonas sp.]|uniref:M48 family metallopeptidase n=1 Tax=Sulfurimonas sp. TaxID=2022749 RepID=UPI002AB185BE|nr:SprT family zinc-dependent metalloprotease [Sulfurimonas sp.]
MHSIEYGTKNIVFYIKRKTKLKNTYIHVDTDGVLVKTNDTTPVEDINKMVSNKSAWISKKLDIFKSIAVNKDITTGSRLYYMGKSYYVNMLKDEDADTVTINFTHSKFHITIPLKCSDVELHNAIENFYKQKAIDKIIPLTKKWAKTMQVLPEHISFRYSKNRWGSCSSTNRISFNYHLVKLSSSLIEYVVIHELAHITYQNHSKDFWKLVHKHLSDYKVKEEKIRVFEKLI